MVCVCVCGGGGSITGYCYNVPETWGQKGQRLCTERQGAKDLRTSRSLWYSLGMCPNERRVYIDIFELILSYGNTGIAGDNGGESRENVLWARTPLSPLCTAPLVPYFLNWKLETKTQYISILADGRRVVCMSSSVCRSNCHSVQSMPATLSVIRSALSNFSAPEIQTFPD